MIGRWLACRSHFSLSQSGKPAAKFILPRPLTNTKLAFTSASDCFPHIDGHTLTDQGNESINIECYRLAVIAQSKPSGSSTPYMFNKLVSLCAKSVDYDSGSQLHSAVVKLGFVSNMYIYSSLVDFYGKCHAIVQARKLFDEMPQKNVVTWNSLISAYVQVGSPETGFELFLEMIREACSHVGWMEKGLEIFNLLSELHSPDLEHYASVVDLFARSGHLYEAEAIINSMPIQPGPSVYKALLSACRTHGNMEISVRASKKLLELYPEESATYILLSSSLATKASWEGAADMRSLLDERKMQRRTAYSWI